MSYRVYTTVERGWTLADAVALRGDDQIAVYYGTEGRPGECGDTTLITGRTRVPRDESSTCELHDLSARLVEWDGAWDAQGRPVPLADLGLTSPA